MDRNINNTIMTNKLNASFDYERISERFLIYEFSTSQKYIKFNAKIFDENLKALGIVHENGKKFYALYSKSDANQNLITESLHKTAEGNNYSIDLIDLKIIPQHLLLQLFMNALSNPQDNFFTFNNVTGKLYCINPDSLHIGRSGIIYEIPALEVRVNNRMELELNIKTFTSLALKNRIIFNNTKLADYPKYRFFNGKLVRIINEEIQLKDTFILRKATNKKNNLSFIDFTDYKHFLLSKCGILYESMSLFNKRFGYFIKLEFERINKINELQFNKYIGIEKNNNIKAFVDNNTFTIIDRINDMYSKIYIEKFLSRMKDIFPKINIVQTDTTHRNKQNFVLIHNKEYYDGYEDPYMVSNKGCVQHITFEDFKNDVDAGIGNVVKELYIKNDLRKHKISIIDWSNFDFERQWLFGTKIEDGFVFMEIQNDGGFSFRNVELNLFDLNEYQKYIQVYEESSVNREVEGIVIDDRQNASILYKSKKFTLPEYVEIGNDLFNANKKLQITKIDFLEWLRRIASSKIYAYISKIEAMDNSVFSREQIIKIITDRVVRKQLSDIIKNETGIPLKTYLRSNEKKTKLFGSNINLHYYTTESATNYFVGEKAQGIKLTFPRASLIREIDGTIDASKIVPLMMVDFVRNEQLTVIPFPFKYLREYIKAEISRFS